MELEVLIGTKGPNKLDIPILRKSLIAFSLKKQRFTFDVDKKHTYIHLQGLQTA